MEALIVLVVLVLLAIPLMLMVALVMVAGLRRRVGVLEETVAELRGQAPAALLAPLRTPTHADAAVGQEDADTPAFLWPHAAAPAPVAAAVAPATPPQPPEIPPLPAEPEVAAAVATAAPAVPEPPQVPPPPRGPGLGERVLGAVKRWFSEGNVPVKIGMLVLLAGVAALLKYVSDQGWLVVPIELRLAGISAAALALLGFGWHQRGRRRMFALALQGGAIGVLLLTVFAAFKRFDLLPAGFAFASSIALVAGLCVLAVVQNSRTLAVLDILAGFMAPLWLSTGSGNHVALFSYYAVLNAGVFAIAWFRPWRALNLLGFAFTFGIATVWGVLQYVPEKFASTEPFLLLFFAFYLLIPLFYARRQHSGRSGIVDGSLVFGTPLVAFSLQAAMLHDQPMTLALCALGLAALYALLARAFIARSAYTVLAQSHAVLAVGFATLAVPLALSERATGAVFALEGAGLVWLGLRQQRWLPQVTGALLQLGAAFAFVAGADHWHQDLRFLLNPTAVGALLLALAGFASALSYQQRQRHDIALVYYLWGVLWWLGGFLHDIVRFIDTKPQVDAVLILAAVTAWLAAEVQRRRPARALGATALVMLATAFPLALLQSAIHHQPFAGYGSLAWAVYALLGVRTLLCLRRGGDGVARLAQFVWRLLWPTVLSLLALWGADQAALAQGWTVLLVTLPWWLLAALSVRTWQWLRWPLAAGRGVRPHAPAAAGPAVRAAGAGLVRWPVAGRLGRAAAVAAVAQPGRTGAVGQPAAGALAVQHAGAGSPAAPARAGAGRGRVHRPHQPGAAWRAPLGRHWLEQRAVAFQPGADQPDRAVERAGRDCLGVGLQAWPARAVDGRRGADGCGAGQAGADRPPAPGQPAGYCIVHCLRPAVHGRGVSGTGPAAGPCRGGNRMKTWSPMLLLAGLVMAAGAMAQSGDDYRARYAEQWGLDMPGAPAGAYRVTLTPEIYRRAWSPQLADVQVFNAAGQAVPAALLAPDQPLAQPPQQQEAPWFVLPPLDARQRNDLQLLTERDTDGRVRRVEARLGDGSDARSAGGWLVDASALHEQRIAALLLDWGDGAQPLQAQVQVDASDDLQQRHPLLGSAPLVDLQQGGKRLLQRRLPVEAGARYLRILPPGSAALPALQGMQVELPPTRAALPWQWLSLAATPAGKGNYTFTAEGRFPVGQANVETADNSLVQWTLYSRDDEDAPWQQRAGPWIAYQLGQDGQGAAAQQSGPQALGGSHRDRYWRLQAASGDSATPPTLRLGYQPEVMVFLSQGAGPYALAVGSATAQRVDAPVGTMIEQLRQRNDPAWQPTQVQVQGAVQPLAGNAALSPARDWKAWLLWALLGAGVLVVGGLALSLLRQKPAAAE
ncbi:MAG: hypothetical protein GAK31_02069 [Stenotrophomonas maltophilia]|uniref:DUF2339 domain-containing protein n=1 Tax=Stenotrophomonas maltophilia TaxID=40324 RepID=A0A7V8JLA3_STEMA|nr:MAG: hypothetical protein GAK31_02069 [Stenotrophomonas maltophilia]